MTKRIIVLDKNNNIVEGKKPHIGAHFYFIDSSYDIIRDIVGYLGEQSFVVQDYDSKNVTEFFYDEYNHNWFTSIAQAKIRVKELKEEL